MHILYKLVDSKPFRVLHNIFLTMITAYAVGLVFFGVSFRMWGQPVSRDDIERRVTNIETQNLEHRVTVMETILAELQNNALWTRLNMGGTGLLIAEAATRTMRQKREKQGSSIVQG